MPLNTIIDLEPIHTEFIDSICRFLPECFAKYSPTWLPDVDACLKLVHSSFRADCCSRVMLDDDGEPIGWIGAITDDDTWEIHPIAVAPSQQNLGVGKLLVADIEELARTSGAVSVWAGTGDETQSTSFSRIDLYQDLGFALKNIDAPKDHAVNFWLAVGYSIVGVLPDEEGLGKPGIHFAKRVV